MTKQARWGIVATLAEPAPLVMAFVAHHLSLGASEIHIYLDEASDPVGDLLAWLPPVRVTRCDRTYWQSVAPRRPRRHNNRQSINATHAQSVCKVHYQGRSDTALRTSDLAPNGFTGHAAGKPMVRTKIGMNIGIHVPRHGHIKDRVVPPHYPADQIELIHFDGLTPLHWASKFIRQAAKTPDRLEQLPPFRIAQWREIATCLHNDAALRALYDRVNGYDAAELTVLEEEGYIVREVFDPTPAIESVFPGQTVDLSPQAFDAVLRPRIDQWLRTARKHGVL